MTERFVRRRRAYSAWLTGFVIGAVGCSGGRPAAVYHPRTREVTVTTVPLLVREAKTVYPFLAESFAKGGVLDGKEVYGFSPSNLTAVEGDTIQFTFVNPEDDAHAFVLPDLVVPLPGQRTSTATYVARHPGVFTFRCSVVSHLPMMSGQLIVLPRSAMATSDSTGAG